MLVFQLKKLLNTEFSVFETFFWSTEGANKIGLSFLFSLCSQMLASFQLCPRKGQATSVHSRQNTPVKNNIRKSVVRICSFDFDEKNLGKRKASKLKLKLGFCFWGNNAGKWKSQFSTGCVFPDFFSQSQNHIFDLNFDPMRFREFSSSIQSDSFLHTRFCFKNSTVFKEFWKVTFLSESRNSRYL